jgi:hypothetical protein
MLTTLQTCGERFRRRYIDKDRRPSGVKAKRGQAVHKVANIAHDRQMSATIEATGGQISLVGDDPLRRKILAESLPAVEEAKDLAATHFAAAIADGVAYNDDEKKEGEAKVRGVELDKAVQMSSFYVERHAPTIDPVAVERDIIIKPTGVDFEIRGIVDLASRENFEPANEEERAQAVLSGIPMGEIEIVHELKTKDKRPSWDAARKSQQLTLYALIRHAQTGKPPDFIAQTSLTLQKKGVVHDHQRAVRTRDDLNAVTERLNSGIEAVERGVFTPANPDAWWCSAKYCDYYADCPFAIGRVSVAVTS